MRAAAPLSTEDKPRPIIHVVAGALSDAAGRILVAQRPPGKHLAGSWEFPGGKLEPGEARAAGLARELREELGIGIRDPRPLMRLQHAYTYGQVLIDMWVVTRYDGEPQGLDGQALRWCHQDELAAVDLLPADRPIVRALRLPERLTQAATPYYSVGGSDRLRRPAPRADVASETRTANDTRLRGVFCASVAQASVGAGADFLVLSEVVAPGELAALCRSVSVPVYARGLALEEAWGLGASGLNELAAAAGS